MEAKTKKMFLMTVIMLVMSLAVTVCPLSGEDSDYYEEDVIRMMLWNWQPECNCSPDMDGAVDRCLEEMAEWTRSMVDLNRVSKREYMDKLVIDLQGERAPDIIWVPDGTVADLAEGEMIISLNEVLEEMPWLIHDIPDEILDNFRVERSMYAIPLGSEDELAQNGYAVTRTAMERGKLGETLEIILFMRERVPSRGKPDLVVSSFEVESETFTEGERLTIMAEVKNIGEEVSEDTMMHFMLDDEMVIDERTIEYLEPGERRSFRIEVEAPTAGMHDYAAMADLGLIEENNKINNTGSSGGMYKSLGGSGIPAAPKALWKPFVIQNEAYRVSIMEYWNKYPNVKVGFDGTNYLVVWMQQEHPFKQEFNHRLVGVRISQMGKILDATPFVITKSAGHYDYFNLAFDGTNCLVVWEKTLGWKQYQANKPMPNPFSMIQGARVSKAGTILDTTPIDIESTPCAGCSPSWSVVRYDRPDVAFTGTDFLVVYRTGIFGGTQRKYGIDARLVTSSGTVKATTRILTFPGQVEPIEMQSLAFNPAQQEGFLLFDASDYAPKPYEALETGIWIKVNGSTVTGSPLHTITKDKLSGVVLFCPAIAADGNGNYLGVFEGKTGVEGALIGPLPSKASAHKGDISKGWDSLPDVAFDGKNYTVVYTHVVGCGEVRLGAVRVTPGGLWSSPACYKTWPKLVRDTSIAFGNINGLVVFSNWDDSSSNPADHSNQIVGMFIDMSL